MVQLPQKKYQRLSKVKPSTADYKRLLTEKTFLRVKERAAGIGVNLMSVDCANLELRFRTESVSIPGKYYTEIIQLSSLTEEDIIETRDLPALLRSAKLKIYSDDPAFLYWGGAYWAWRQGYGLFPERRFPRVRNPYHRLYTSKHMYAVLRTFPFLSTKIAGYLRRYWSAEQQKTIADSLDRLMKKIRTEDLLGM